MKTKKGFTKRKLEDGVMSIDCNGCGESFLEMPKDHACEPKPTPTPWKVMNWSDSLITISNGDIDGIANIRTADPDEKLDAEDTANAAYIVLAVNAYAGHVKALEIAKQRIIELSPDKGFDKSLGTIAKAEGK